MTTRPRGLTLESVKRRTLRLVMMLLTSVLASSFVATTSFAFYRVSMGAKQCCKSHCRHHMPTRRAAEQCCRTHPDVAPAATAKVVPPDAVAPVLAIAVATPIVSIPAVAPNGAAERRGPPGGTLVSQHTSLAL